MNVTTYCSYFNLEALKKPFTDTTNQETKNEMQ